MDTAQKTDNRRISREAYAAAKRALALITGMSPEDREAHKFEEQRLRTLISMRESPQLGVLPETFNRRERRIANSEKRRRKQRKRRK